MIFKVFYQEQRGEVPVRERTQSLFIEAESDRDVRDKLYDRNYNIEYIHPLDEAHLDYEKKTDHYKLENA